MGPAVAYCGLSAIKCQRRVACAAYPAHFKRRERRATNGHLTCPHLRLLSGCHGKVCRSSSWSLMIIIVIYYSLTACLFCCCVTRPRQVASSCECSRSKPGSGLHLVAESWMFTCTNKKNNNWILKNAVIVQEQDGSKFDCGGSSGNPFSHQYGNPYNIFLLSLCHVTRHIKAHQRL